MREPPASRRCGRVAVDVEGLRDRIDRVINERGAGSSNLLYGRTAAISERFIAKGFCIATPRLIGWSPPRCRRLALTTDVPEPRSFIRYQHTDGPSCSGSESKWLSAAGKTSLHIRGMGVTVKVEHCDFPIRNS